MYIGFCIYKVEHGTIYNNQPIIYTKVIQYKQLYQNNKRVFNDIVMMLEKNNVDYDIALVNYQGEKSIEARANDKNDNIQGLLKNKKIVKDLDFITKKLKLNYIASLPSGNKNEMSYVFTRRDYSPGHNYYIGLRFLRNVWDVDSKHRFDKNWLCFQNIDLDFYPFYQRVYNTLYN